MDLSLVLPAQCELTVRARNALAYWRPSATLADIKAMTDAERAAIPGMGRKSIKEIRDLIEAMERSTAPEPAAMVIRSPVKGVIDLADRSLLILEFNSPQDALHERARLRSAGFPVMRVRLWDQR